MSNFTKVELEHLDIFISPCLITASPLDLILFRFCCVQAFASKCPLQVALTRHSLCITNSVNESHQY